MKNYTKAPDVSLDFHVAVTSKGVKITSPQIDIEINLGAMPEKDRLFRGTGKVAHTYCMENNIPVDGDIFLILSSDEDFEKSGHFKALFVPELALRH
jgi:hypothetical protein